VLGQYAEIAAGQPDGVELLVANPVVDGLKLDGVVLGDTADGAGAICGGSGHWGYR
jgi:hypothetical protein